MLLDGRHHIQVISMLIEEGGEPGLARNELWVLSIWLDDGVSIWPLEAMKLSKISNQTVVMHPYSPIMSLMTVGHLQKKRLSYNSKCISWMRAGSNIDDLMSAAFLETPNRAAGMGPMHDTNGLVRNA